MSTELGQQAEQIAAEWLHSQGFRILDRNWRDRWSEIDIVAGKDGAVHFVEVKYRKSDQFGAGFEYVTADKQRRLQRAAEAWLMENEHTASLFQIDVLSVTGPLDRAAIEYLPNAVLDSGVL